LEKATVSDAVSLMTAVQVAGLGGTPDVKGAIEEIRRLDDERVTIRGWSIDGAAGGSRLTVLAFADGRHVLTALTKGPRKDVAQSFGLSDAAAANASFLGTLRCEKGQKLIVIAVTASRMYSHFRTVTCP
jgi:hypothetical protein